MSLDTWARFMIKKLMDDGVRYEWYELTLFTRWLRSPKQTILLVFDPPAPIANKLPSPLLDGRDAKGNEDPFWIYTLLVEEVVRLQDEAVWAIRNQVRATEVTRGHSTNPARDFPYQYGIIRHCIHVSEMLDGATKTTDSILTSHKDFVANTLSCDKTSNHSSTYIRQRLLFYKHMFDILQSRSTSIKERMLNEMQLSFNTVTLTDSSISNLIASATQEDSAAMKSIAFATLTFLPATFISAIFSMSFFNYNADSGSWSVSDKFWLYWVVAIPTTVVTSLLWYFWRKVFPPSLIRNFNMGDVGSMT